MSVPFSGVDWRPACSLQTAKLRADMLASARAFFSDHDILEVDTPSLSEAAISDPNIETIAVQLSADAKRQYFLQTSPEFAMKRLLCAGWPDIYQICKVYRDGELGRRHQPEFTMIEWYRRGHSLQSMMEHTAEFIATMLCDAYPAKRIEYLSYAEAFERYTGLDPLTASIGEMRELSGADPGLAKSLADDRDAWLDYLLESRVARDFSKTGLTILHHYPATQAALARLCESDRRYADRFEIFAGELELANGYYELANAGEQRRRMEEDQIKRSRVNAAQRPLDEKFLAALEAGLPSCCGVAVGFDRLVMLQAEHSRVQDVQSFAVVDTDDAG
ncbi:MAG: EF-P lysine aminoacylase GenX [Woeseia sp.]|nr:EF-P lysine aminoacylase GenX [Woeseia sp.]NNE59851.1 EF-P lysine aminoacylase GenX [Woeseia sp.]